VLDVNSAYSLLRISYRSIDIKVKSRHARNFLKRRLIEQWRENRAEQDHRKQRFLMERAGIFLQALHAPLTENAGKEPVVFQLSRVKAREEAEKAPESPVGRKQ
jgi:ribonuclease D